MINYETLTHFNETNTTLGYLYREMCNLADTVNNELRDLEKITNDNIEKFKTGAHLFYQRSTAEQAADFERAFAKYEAIEQAFMTAAHEAGIEREDIVQLMLDARKVR